MVELSPKTSRSGRRYNATISQAEEEAHDKSETSRIEVQDQDEIDTDVLIVGGGVVGCSLANQLIVRAPSLRVVLVEASVRKEQPSKEEH